MINHWLDLLIYVIGGIALAVISYCAWDSFRCWRAGRSQLPKQPTERRRG